jgi:Flp pilus assembly protein TadD/mono/diheme cytochrome c family protein
MRRSSVAAVLVLSPWACGPDDEGMRAGEAPVQPAVVAAATVPDAPTFAEHVGPLVYRHCAPCHHDGGSAPLHFTDPDTVREHARQIAEVTASGFMPPWLPEPGHGEHIGARRLDPVEIDTLARWVEQGAPAGDMARAPEPPVFEAGWRLGPPDLVLDTGAPYELPADGTDVYRNFVIAVPPGAMKLVRAVEIAPGAPAVVHHGVLRIDTSGEVRRLDAADPAPGFDGMVFAGAHMPDGRFLGWTPGKAPTKGSDDRAWRLPGGSDLVLQLHLRPSGKPEPIRAEVALYFAKRPPTRPALSMELASTAIDLPAGAEDVHVTDAYTVPADVSILSVYPHAHYLGRRVDAWAELPGGEKRWLVKIDDWDFDWQDEYRFVRPVRLPRGSTIHMDWTFDNSAGNPRNPSSPPRRVTYGPSSTDEMAELILEVEPDDPRQLPQLDRDFRRKWMMAQAGAFESRLAADPRDVEAAVSLGALRHLAGETAAAVAAYEAALAIEPSHARANLELAIVLMGEGDLDAASARLARAEKTAPRDPRVALTLGNLHRKRDALELAVRAYRRALAIDDTLVEAHNNLGIVLERQGDLAGAIEAFRRAVELQPGAELFAKNLARVRAKAR